MGPARAAAATALSNGPWKDYSRALARLCDEVARAAEEAARWGAEASRARLRQAAELERAAAALARAAAGGGARAEASLVEAKKRVLEVERMHRNARRQAQDDPRFVEGLKAAEVQKRLAGAAGSLSKAADILVQLLVASLLLLFPASTSAETLKLTVFHTNDIHGWIMARPSKEDPKRQIGGAAALAALYRRHPGPKLLLDAGDWFQGTPEGNETRGAAVIDVFNALPYDAVVVGNHDYDFAEPRLEQLVRLSQVPVLGANIYDEKTGKRPAYLKPWIVKDVAGVKVGLFGLLTTNMHQLAFSDNYKGFTFRREIDEAKDAVAALRKQGATVIIAVTHVGFDSPEMGSFEGDQFLARSVAGIDLIVGGHTHTFLRPAVREATHGTLIVQAGFYLTAAGRVTLEIDPKTKKVVFSTGTLVNLWIDETGEDAELAALVKKHSDEVGRRYAVVIATAAAALTRNREAESTMGDWMTDCLREWAKADLAVHNGGGIRSDFAAGPITLRDVFNLMPFDNRMVVLEMDGALVAEVLDQGVGPGKGMGQVSGASFRYDRSRDAGKRLADIKIGGVALDAKRTYTVVASDFIVRRGDGYNAFESAPKKKFTGTLMRDVLIECARRQAVLRVPPGGRLVPGLN